MKSHPKQGNLFEQRGSRSAVVKFRSEELALLDAAETLPTAEDYFDLFRNIVGDEEIRQVADLLELEDALFEELDILGKLRKFYPEDCEVHLWYRLADSAFEALRARMYFRDEKGFFYWRAKGDSDEVPPYEC